MAKIKVELKVDTYSSINKFMKWYEEAYSYKSGMGRIMKGKTKDFLIRVIENKISGKVNKEDEDAFKNFSALKDLSQEEINARNALKNNPEELETYLKIQKKIKAHNNKK